MGPRCSSAETQVCHRSYIIAARLVPNLLNRVGVACIFNFLCCVYFWLRVSFPMLLVEHELFTLPDHLNLHPVFSEVRVTRSLVLCLCFVDRCLSFCTLSVDHCVVCSSSIYGFWLPLWYFQTLLVRVSGLSILDIVSLLFDTIKLVSTYNVSYW